MAVYDNSYSRFIAWVKILLPLVALGIFSTLFLYSRKVDPTQAIPYAKVDATEIAREQRIGAPNYAGVTRDGTAISIAASAAHPDPKNPQTMIATGLRAEIRTPTGIGIDITAARGEIQNATQTARLDGGVDIRTSTGYRIQTRGVTAALNETLVTTDGSVTAKSPFGPLQAGKMVLRRATGGKSGYVLVFKDGVKLIYDPRE